MFYVLSGDGDRGRLPAVLRTLWCLLFVSAVSAWGAPGSAQAQEAIAPGESDRSLPGLLQLSLPTPNHSSVVSAVGIGYGLLDEVNGSADGHRAHGILSTAFALHPLVSFGVDVAGHMDAYSDASLDPSTKLYGEPRLTARFATEVGSQLYLGAEADVRLVGAEAPSIDLPSTTPSLSGLFATQLGDALWLGTQLGFQLDRSAEAIPDDTILLPADARTVGPSSFNRLKWGAGASFRVAEGTELLGEVSAETLLGSGAPSALESPLRFSAGARQALSQQLLFLGMLDVGLSSRPDAPPQGTFVPVEPRVAVQGGLIWRWDAPEPAPAPAPPPKAEPKPEPKPVAPPEPEVPTSDVTGSVVNEAGEPLSDVEVTLLREGEEPAKARTFADGTFKFEAVPEGAAELRVTTPGFDAATVVFAEGEPRTREIVLRPAVPAGQVRGRVLDLKGAPVDATITVTPGDQVASVNADGSFELELAPGRYTVTFKHPDFTNQKRVIRIHDRGVVILNIALTR